METVRTYSLIFSGGDNQTSSIELRDSANELLDCNYVSFAASGPTAGDGRYQRMFVSFDADSIQTPLENQSTANNSLGDTSGITGLGSPTLVGETREFAFSDKDRVNTVKVSLFNTAPVIVIITYGQVQKANISRKNNRPIGR